jgi:hypothetical protein
VVFCLFVACPAYGETAFDDTREKLHDDGLGSSGQPKDRGEIPGKYLLLAFILKTRGDTLPQVSDRAGNLARDIENLEAGCQIYFFALRPDPEGKCDRFSRTHLCSG